jgi:nitrite reductase/ring-hydroxylating ferredoxin subunit
LLKDRNTLVINNPAFENEILLVKKSAREYNALLMRCSHKGAALEVKQEKLKCPDHGSIFDFDGNVIQDPASKPLTKFPVEVNENQVLIYLKQT